MSKSNTFPKPSKATLSVVIPAYNSENWIQPTLEAFYKSLKGSQWKNVEVILIDDGSTDKTAANAKAVKVPLNLKVITQPNSGRLEARRNGISRAKGEYILLLDSRVFTAPKAMKYLTKRIEDHPDEIVWNGHIIVEREGNLYARFWYAITVIAWRRYLANPRHLSFGLKEFDYYPKGAGCFFAPKTFLEQAYKQFVTTYKEDKYANDDTALLRFVVAQSPIHIAPEFAFTYNSRSTLKAFIRHTVHRGIVFLDGYFHKESRYYYLIWAYFLLLPVALAAVVLKPWLLLLLPAGMVGLVVLAKAAGNQLADALALGWVAPLFAVYYSIGIFKGLRMRLSNRQPAKS